MNPCGFACPQEPLERDLLDTITRTRSARLARLFAKCFCGELLDRAPGVSQVIEAFASDPGSFPDSWPSAIGKMRAAMLERPFDSRRALVAGLSLAFELAERKAVSASVTLDSPESFGFRGYTLPEATRIDLESDGRNVRLELDGAEWRGTGTELGRVRGVLFASETLPEGLERVKNPDAGKYSAAFDLIAEHAGIYLPWVERVIRAIVPVAGRPEATTSSSFEMLPGVIALSAESPSIWMADALVHEASHQHFYLLTQAGPVDDGTDTELYYSPAPRAERPIDKILLAYHAFANVLLFYRACRASGLADATLAIERSYEESLAVLESALGKTRALTPLGRALFAPLASRVRPRAVAPRVDSKLSFVRP